MNFFLIKYFFKDVFKNISKTFKEYSQKVVKKQAGVIRVIMFILVNEIFEFFWVLKNHESLHFKFSKKL